MRKSFKNKLFLNNRMQEDKKGTTIRFPATANLMIDSADRDETRFPLANAFQITKNNSILNGFFTRIGTTEVVFEYNYPNVSDGSYYGSNLSVQYTDDSEQWGPLAPANGFYTVAQLINWLVDALNTSGGSTTWTAVVNPSGAAGALFTATGTSTQTILAGTLIDLLFGSNNTPIVLDPSGTSNNKVETLSSIDLRPYRYIDFISPELTYPQDLKDASTAPLVRDVLCRWYFDWDTPTAIDSYGFPILMGYTPFYARRLFNPPKQIKWDSNLPIGNISFQLYGNDGNIAVLDSNSNWLMTCQVSEN